MASLIRIFTIIISLVIGWSLIFIPLFLTIYLIWYFFLMPAVSAGFLPMPPNPWPIVDNIVISGIFLFLGISVLYLLMPVQTVIRAMMKGIPREKLTPSHPLTILVSELSKQMGLPMPSVYIYQDRPNAFALSSALTNAVGFSDELLELLSPDELRWVIAHELAHIKRFDSGANGLWLASSHVLDLGYHFHTRLMRMFFGSILETRANMLILSILFLPFIIIGQLSRLLLKTSRFIFLFFDRIFVRGTEYNADELATLTVGGASGFNALRKLDHGVEPDFNGLLATHPTTDKRLQHMEKVESRRLKELQASA